MDDSVLAALLRTGRVSDSEGTSYPLRSSISHEEGLFLQALIAANRGISSTLEVGLGFGVSSLFICAALAGRRGASHTAIDPHQATDWHSIGATNLALAGCDFFRLVENESAIALPTLLQQDCRFHLALIDGWHTFDQVLVDFFYINRMLTNTGIVVFDDADYPAVAKAIAHAASYPAYVLAGAVSSFTRRERAGHRRSTQRLEAERILPTSIRAACDQPPSMVALRKVAPDHRPWSWYRAF